jgi:hypothetical protein
MPGAVQVRHAGKEILAGAAGWCWWPENWRTARWAKSRFVNQQNEQGPKRGFLKNNCSTKLSLTWSWTEVLSMVLFLKILKQVGLTWALLSAHVLYISIAANEYGEVNKEVWTLDSGQ